MAEDEMTQSAEREVVVAFGTKDHSDPHLKIVMLDDELPMSEQFDSIQGVQIRVTCYGDDITSPFIEVWGSDSQKVVAQYKRVHQSVPELMRRVWLT